MKRSTVSSVPGLRWTGVRLAVLVTLSAFIVGIITATAKDGAVPLIQRPASTLTIDDRVGYQRAIEEVYWRHRIWPAENKRPKPRFDEVMSQSGVRAKVEACLRMSTAVESYWQRPITSEQLQAEIDRMVAQTKEPELLRELWTALGNNSYLVAECLARPVLVERLARNWYAYDERFHGEIRAHIASELSKYHSASEMRQLDGFYNEGEWRLGAKDPTDSRPGALEVLPPDEWDARGNKLAQVFASGNPQNTPGTGQSWLSRIPVGEESSLQEREDGFFVVSVLEKNRDHIRVASVEWKKEPFDSWWSKAGAALPFAAGSPASNYSLKPIAPAAGTDVWDSMVSAAPSARYNHSAVWTGSEMIIWGGIELTSCCSTTYSNTGGRYNPATDTWVLTNTINAPTARSQHTAVWTGTQMIVWGGADSRSVYNTGGRYDPVTDTWTGVNTAGAPTPRVSHTAVWTGSEMIVWGGTDNACCSSTAVNTGARYNPANDGWTATNIGLAPTGRAQHTAVWTGIEMVVWGGLSSPGNTSSALNTGGRYNPSTNNWTGTNTAGAATPRGSHTAVWTGTEMIVWGGSTIFCCSGNNTGGRYNPTNDSWSQTSVVGAPDGRAGHTAVWTGSVMIIWGGNLNFNSILGARYRPADDSWTATNPTNAPSSRSSHTAVWTGAEMIIWGGNNSNFGSVIGARYNASTNSWTATSAIIAPIGRERQAAVWTGSEMVVWGGYSTLNGVSSIQNTGSRFSPALNNWTATTTTGAPTARFGHTAVWTGTEMIVWGGYDGTNVLNTGSRYSTVSNIWVDSDPAPTFPRYQHTAIWSGTEMIVWGGSDGFNFFNSGCKYNPSAHTWSVTDVASAPAARANHTAIWSGTEMIVWGGNNDSGFLNSGARYTPGSNNWVAVSSSGAPEPRINHTAVWTGTDMIIWGGSNANQLNTGAKYTRASNSWSNLNPFGAPSARSNHTAVWTGIDMIVWGGFDGSNFLKNGSRYNPSINGWALVNSINAPSERSRHTGLWTGTQMLIWGGFDGVNYLTTGSRYIAPLSSTCGYGITPGSSFCQSAGMQCEIIVTADGTCSWAAESQVPWIIVRSEPGGVGSAAVGIEIKDNFNAMPRTGSVVVAGQTYTLVQNGTASLDCTYTLNPTFANFTANAGSGSFQLTTDALRCGWAAVSGASWITITSNPAGIGSATINFTVDANPNTSYRKGTITVGHQTFAIKQKGSS